MVFRVAAGGAATVAAVVVGSIVDPTGARPGVRGTIKDVAVRTADSVAAGDFAFQNLPDGDYESSRNLTNTDYVTGICAALGASARPPHVPDVLDRLGSSMWISPSGYKIVALVNSPAARLSSR